MPVAVAARAKSGVDLKPLPKGPAWRYLAGMLLESRHNALGFLERCARQYGDVFTFRFITLPFCYIGRPELIESVLVTHFSNFTKSEDYRALRRVLGEGLVTSEGETWRRHRRLMQPAFHRERFEAYAGLMGVYAERAVESWRPGQVFDVHKEMMQLTLEIVAQALLGTEVAGQARDVGEALDELLRQFVGGSIFILPGWLPTPANFRTRRAVRKLDQTVYRIIQSRRAAGSGGNDLLSILLAARDEDGSRLSDLELRDETMTLFLAGHETTAIALSWTWFLLAQNPSVEAEMLRELNDALGGRPVTTADLARLKFTAKVIKESMRLYPPVWGIGRRALEDVNIGGYRLPAGMNVFMTQWLVHRDPRYYPSPLDFNPHRWTEEFERRLPSFAYFPFGGGPRVCIGTSFALTEALVLLATIARRFKLELAEKPEAMPSVTLRPRHGIKMVPTRREKLF